MCFLLQYQQVCVSSINQAPCLQEAGCVELGKEAKNDSSRQETGFTITMFGFCRR